MALVPLLVVGVAAAEKVAKAGIQGLEEMVEVVGMEEEMVIPIVQAVAVALT